VAAASAGVAACWSGSMLEDPGMLDCGLVVVEDGVDGPTTTYRLSMTLPRTRMLTYSHVDHVTGATVSSTLNVTRDTCEGVERV
jgi:hypothetical protein